MLFISWLFGCGHRRKTFPITRNVRGFRKGTYVVCLDCGKEFSYDWQQMKITGTAVEQPAVEAEEQA